MRRIQILDNIYLMFWVPTGTPISIGLVVLEGQKNSIGLWLDLCIWVVGVQWDRYEFGTDTIVSTTLCMGPVQIVLSLK